MSTPPDLLQQLRDLPQLPALTKPGSWLHRRARLRRKMLAYDWEDFLSWPTTIEALHFPAIYLTELELEDLDDRLIQAATFPHTGLTGTSVHQAWHILQWEEFTGKRVESLEWIYEFGGGYGPMALLCSRLGYFMPYTIADFPELHLLQKYFLGRAGVKNVSYCDSMILDGKPDLYIAIYSLSEVPPEEKVVQPAASYLIAYQDDWSEMDNVRWLAQWREDMGKDYIWKDYADPYYPGHRILLGDCRH